MARCSTNTFSLQAHQARFDYNTDYNTEALGYQLNSTESQLSHIKVLSQNKMQWQCSFTDKPPWQAWFRSDRRHLSKLKKKIHYGTYIVCTCTLYTSTLTSLLMTALWTLCRRLFCINHNNKTLCVNSNQIEREVWQRNSWYPLTKFTNM